MDVQLSGRFSLVATKAGHLSTPTAGAESLAAANALAPPCAALSTARARTEVWPSGQPRPIIYITYSTYAAIRNHAARAPLQRRPSLPLPIAALQKHRLATTVETPISKKKIAKKDRRCECKGPSRWSDV
jgi:hypothetical protein